MGGFGNHYSAFISVHVLGRYFVLVFHALQNKLPITKIIELVEEEVRESPNYLRKYFPLPLNHLVSNHVEFDPFFKFMIWEG